MGEAGRWRNNTLITDTKKILTAQAGKKIIIIMNSFLETLKRRNAALYYYGWLYCSVSYLAKP
jgi:hypothetical protein